MLKKHSVANVESLERRKHWVDRRSGDDRRNDARMRIHGDDCRSGAPRRASDVDGALADGEIWWRAGAGERR